MLFMNRDELGRSLFEQLDQGVFVESVTDPDWQGEPGKCHENVERWIALHPADRPVRGYLVTPLSDFCAIFALHSLVRRQDGSLVDVTPLEYQCRFIRYEMSDRQFGECKRHLGQIVYLPMDWADFLAMPVTDDEPEL
jgi:hypothetical protein